MDVDENAGLFEGYQLKLNSYDLGVDIELADAVQRLRFEHPEVKAVVLRSGKDRVFCAGANIRMLAGSTPRPQGQLLQVHQRDPQRHRGFQRQLRAEVSVRHPRHRRRRRLRAGARGRPHPAGRRRQLLRGACPSCRCSRCCPAPAASPASPTSARCGATWPMRSARWRRACKGARAVKWRLVDQAVPNSKFDAAVKEAAAKLAARSDRPGGDARGIALTPLERRIEAGCRHLFVCEGGDRPRLTPRHPHAARAQRAAACLRRGDVAAGRAVLAAAAGARAGRRHPAPAPQRGRDRRADLQVAGRPGPGAGLRCVPRRQQGPLARRARSCTTGSAR